MVEGGQIWAVGREIPGHPQLNETLVTYTKQTYNDKYSYIAICHPKKLKSPPLTKSTHYYTSFRGYIRVAMCSPVQTLE